MTLTKGVRVDIEQNSPGWYEWRKTGLGGSDAPVIYYGKNYDSTVATLVSEKLGLTEKRFTDAQQANIDRGHALEPKARAKFEEVTGFRVNPVCMYSPTFPFMLVSLDGITEDGRVAVEIKAPGDKAFQELIERGNIAEGYYAQVQHQISVSGAEEYYYWAYNENIAPYFFIQHIKPDYPFITELIRREEIVWNKYISQGIIPDEKFAELNSAEPTRTGLVMFSGAAGSGKDTIGDYWIELYKAKRFSPSDSLRDVYQKMVGITAKQLAKNKEEHRPALVTLGHEMRKYVPNVWIDSIFNPNTGIYQAMQGTGAINTSVRYANEVSHGRYHANRLGVPSRLIYIERPGVEFANETEAATLPIVKKLSDVLFTNDVNLKTDVGRQAMIFAVLDVMNTNTADYKYAVKVSDFLEKAQKELKILNEPKGKRRR